MDDVHHRKFDDLIHTHAPADLRLLTTWPCIVEATYLLEVPQRYEMLQWIELGGALVYPFDTHHLTDMIKWMKHYSKDTKREMDLADASLYGLALETSVTTIMTVDIADFSRYRLPDGKAFEIL